MLFATGMGILIYENIEDIGHIVSSIALCVLTVVCFLYVFKNSVAYSNEQVTSPSLYFDYVVLLGSLLFISVQGYLQFQYAILDENLGFSTLITATLFFSIAYRFDHLGVLSLAITALASFWTEKWGNLNAEAFIISQTMGGNRVVVDDSMKGGGGASGGY